MDVILCQDVKNLGQVGDVVKVKDGFARNLLIPKKLAFIATPANLKRIELQKKQRQIQFEQEKSKALKTAEELSKVSCTINVEANDLDRLYGSISEAEIAQALEVEGYTIDKKHILIENPIEELGIFEIGVKLHSEVTAKIRLWVTKK